MIKKVYRNTREFLYLVKHHKNSYKDFFKNDYRKLCLELKTHGVKGVRVYQLHEWKLWYNCCYFLGHYEKKKVFIKVMGPDQYDCYTNEVLVNSYISENSEELEARMPKILLNFEWNNYYIIVSEFVSLSPVPDLNSIQIDLQKVLSEYNRIGILHTDFGLVNIGSAEGKYYFFDYGTSLCPLSNLIRVRNGEMYNHIREITEDAKRLMPDADYYYDDILHLGGNKSDLLNDENNYLVGRRKYYIARLNGKYYKFELVKKNDSGAVCLLKRCMESGEAE